MYLINPLINALKHHLIAYQQKMLRQDGITKDDVSLLGLVVS
jgi:hypothetical protein